MTGWSGVSEGQIDGIGTRPRLLAKDVKGAIRLTKRCRLRTSGTSRRRSTRSSHSCAASSADGSRQRSAIALCTEAPSTATRQSSGLQCRPASRFTALLRCHQPNDLAPIRAILERQPHLLQVACFDTAFHRGHPELADYYAIPQQLYLEGIRRYGFHGLSYEYIAGRLGEVAPEIANGKVVVAHLGSGASMCAISAGKSVESTMGFTALDGLPMGTRPGQLDPGVLLYLMTEKGMSADATQRFLYNDCGLKGLSGVSKRCEGTTHKRGSARKVRA